MEDKDFETKYKQLRDAVDEYLVAQAEVEVSLQSLQWVLDLDEDA